jgi:hypothetical protein
VVKSDSAIKQKTKELRRELKNADMNLFDRYMKWRVGLPKDQIDQKAKKPNSK